MATVPGKLYGKVANRLGAERKVSKAEAERREAMRKLAIKYETRLDMLRDEHKETVRLLKLDNARSQTTIGELRKTLKAFAEWFDHDEDAHRYRTLCRVCESEKALGRAAAKTGGSDG